MNETPNFQYKSQTYMKNLHNKDKPYRIYVSLKASKDSAL